jgi:hypothetical protein
VWIFFVFSLFFFAHSLATTLSHACRVAALSCCVVCFKVLSVVTGGLWTVVRTCTLYVSCRSLYFYSQKCTLTHNFLLLLLCTNIAETRGCRYQHQAVSKLSHRILPLVQQVKQSIHLPSFASRYGSRYTPPHSGDRDRRGTIHRIPGKNHNTEGITSLQFGLAMGRPGKDAPSNMTAGMECGAALTQPGVGES